MTRKSINLFYSWQSDLPHKTNKNAIRESLRNIKKKLLNKEGIDLKIEEATSNLAGSPNIPISIIQKIQEADIFICDISTINKGSKFRKSPNPNVIFELGYAVSELGWDRIILLFNSEYGKLKDVPFDFDRQRIMEYRLANNKMDSSQLTDKLKIGIKSITTINPQKAINQRGLSVQEIKKGRDSNTLKWILRTIHIPTLIEYTECDPTKIDGAILFFWESFNSIVQSGLFYIYDEELKKVIMNLHKSWALSLPDPSLYYPSDKSNTLYFEQKNKTYLTKKESDILSKIEKEREKTKASILKLQNVVRKKYIELDPAKLSQEAIREYRMLH